MCYECGRSGPKLFACLHCIYFGCKGDHILKHFEASNHYIGLALNHSMLYCYHCKDYVHDDQCREIAKQHQSKEARSVNSQGQTNAHLTHFDLSFQGTELCHSLHELATNHCGDRTAEEPRHPSNGDAIQWAGTARTFKSRLHLFHELHRPSTHPHATATRLFPVRATRVQS